MHYAVKTVSRQELVAIAGKRRLDKQVEAHIIVAEIRSRVYALLIHYPNGQGVV